LSQPNPTSGLPTTPTGNEPTVHEERTKNEVVNLLGKGVEIPKKVISLIAGTFSNLEESINAAREEIEELEKFCEEYEIVEFNLSKFFWAEYYPIRTNLRKTRENLRFLARQTVTFANETEIIFNSALGNESKLKTVMERMKRFLKKSGQILEASKTEYDSAMTKMENFLPKFKDFERNMGTLTDYNSERCYHGTTLATMMVFGCTSWHYNMVAMKKKSEKLVTRLVD